MAAKKAPWKLRVTDDRMAVLVDCKVTAKTLPFVAVGIEAELKHMGIADPPDREAIVQRLLAAATQDAQLTGVAVVQGKRPVPPRDAGMEWQGDFFRTGFAVDKRTGRVDYRRPKRRPEVKEGQLLARLPRLRKGLPGRTVFGEEVPVNESEAVRGRAGENVRTESAKDGICFYSMIDGRVGWEDDTVFVEKVLTVNGDVGLATGNITHPGVVLIQGSVLEGARVTAGGSLEITGVAEDAHVSTEADLLIGGGILDSPTGTVRAKGRIEAKFIVGTAVEAGGDVTVAKELTNARVRAGGAVDVAKGRVVGGEIIALGGITVGQAGSDGLWPTLLVAGDDYTLAEELDPLRAKIARLEQTLKTMEEKLAPVAPDRDKLPESLKETFDKLTKKAEGIRETLKDLRAQVEEIVGPSRGLARPRIVINEKLYPEVTLRIFESSLTVRQLMTGPIEAVLEDGEIVLRHTGKAEDDAGAGEAADGDETEEPEEGDVENESEGGGGAPES